MQCKRGCRCHTATITASQTQSRSLSLSLSCGRTRATRLSLVKYRRAHCATQLRTGVEILGWESVGGVVLAFMSECAPRGLCPSCTTAGDPEVSAMTSHRASEESHAATHAHTTPHTTGGTLALTVGYYTHRRHVRICKICGPVGGSESPPASTQRREGPPSVAVSAAQQRSVDRGGWRWSRRRMYESRKPGDITRQGVEVICTNPGKHAQLPEQMLGRFLS